MKAVGAQAFSLSTYPLESSENPFAKVATGD